MRLIPKSVLLSAKKQFDMTRLYVIAVERVTLDKLEDTLGKRKSLKALLILPTPLIPFFIQ